MRGTTIQVSTMLVAISIMISLIYDSIQVATGHDPNNAPEITTPTDGQVFTFNESQGLTASIIVEATDPDAEDLVDITNSPLPPYAYWEFLETHEQPSSGRVTWEDRGPVEGTYTVTFVAVDEHGATSLPVKASVVVNPSEAQLDNSVLMKIKKKVALLAIKNNDGASIYGLEIKRSTDGNLGYVKARGWEGFVASANTAIIETDNRPITNGNRLVVLLGIDNKPSWLSWATLDAERNVLSSGALFSE